MGATLFEAKGMDRKCGPEWGIQMSQISRIESFLFRALWLIMRGMAKNGSIDPIDIDNWQRDYMNAGGGSISPPRS
jgi:hypothetical protein